MPDYEVTEHGVEWASAQLGRPVEAGETVKLTPEDDTALVAAGWLIPQKKGGKD